MSNKHVKNGSIFSNELISCFTLYITCVVITKPNASVQTSVWFLENEFK